MNVLGSITDFLAFRFGPPAAGLVEVYPEFTAPAIILGVLLATVAGMLSVPVLDAVKGARTVQVRTALLLLGGTGLGCGIWALHFTSMMATSFPAAISYSPVVTTIAVVPAVCGSAFALRQLGTDHPPLLRSLRAGCLFALGVIGMHYTGMEAMRGLGAMHYAPGATIVAAVVAPLASALGFFFLLRTADLRAHPPIIRASGGLGIGLAVTVIHFNLTLATRYFVEFTAEPAPMSAFIIQGVVFAMALLFLLTFVTVLVHHNFLRLERAVENAEDFTRQVLEQADDFHVLVHESGAILTANQSAEVLFGMPNHALPGLLITQVLPAALADDGSADVHCLEQWSGQRLQVLLADSDCMFTTSRLRTGLLEIPRTLELTTTRLRRGNETVYSLMGHEITERLEEQRRARFLASAVEASSESIAIYDKNAKVIYLNPAGRRRLRNRHEVYVGRDADDVFWPFAETPNYHSFRAAMQKGQRWQGELERVLPAGRRLAEFVSVSMIVGVDGKVSQYVAITRKLREWTPSASERSAPVPEQQDAETQAGSVEPHPSV